MGPVEAEAGRVFYNSSQDGGGQGWGATVTDMRGGRGHATPEGPES